MDNNQDHINQVQHSKAAADIKDSSAVEHSTEWQSPPSLQFAKKEDEKEVTDENQLDTSTKVDVPIESKAEISQLAQITPPELFPAPPLILAPVQRQTEKNEELEEEPSQLSKGLEIDTADTPPPNDIGNTSSKGNANLTIQKAEDASNNSGISRGFQANLEQTIGTDLSNVSIHENSTKATEVGALAYTQGNDIHFAPGQYNPSSQSGQELIGHEMTHVKQQRDGRVKPTTEVNGMPVNDNPGLEKEADVVGAKAVQKKANPNKSIDNLTTSQSKILQAKKDPIQRDLNDLDPVAGVRNPNSSTANNDAIADIEGTNAREMAAEYINDITSIGLALIERQQMLNAAEGIEPSIMVRYHVFLTGLPSQGIFLIQSDYLAVRQLLTDKILQLNAENQTSPEDYQEGISLSPQEELAQRERTTLDAAGVAQGFNRVYGTLRSHARSQANIMSYQTFHTLGENPGVANSIFANLVGNIRDEIRDRGLNALTGNPGEALNSPGLIPRVFAFLPLAEGMLMLHQESQWNQRNPQRRLAYRTEQIYNYLLVQYAQSLAAEDPSRSSGEVLSWLQQQTTNYQQWEREDLPELRSWANENLPREQLQDNIGPSSQFKTRDSSSIIQNTISGNSPSQVPESFNSKLEQTIGTNLSNVSIHENSSKATEVGALAYTQGNDIHFAPGQFNPSSQSGQELIGHEMTHVKQQRDGRVKPTTEVNGMPVNDNPGLEKEADVVGAKAASSNSPVQKKSKKKVTSSYSGGDVIQNKIAVAQLEDGDEEPQEQETVPDTAVIRSGSTTFEYEDNNYEITGKYRAIIHQLVNDISEDGSISTSFSGIGSSSSSDGTNARVELTVKIVKRMPIWTDLPQVQELAADENESQREYYQNIVNAWTTFYNALDAHEEGHKAIDQGHFANSHTRLIGKTMAEIDAELIAIENEGVVLNETFHTENGAQETIRDVQRPYEVTATTDDDDDNSVQYKLASSPSTSNDSNQTKPIDPKQKMDRAASLSNLVHPPVTVPFKPGFSPDSANQEVIQGVFPLILLGAAAFGVGFGIGYTGANASSSKHADRNQFNQLPTGILRKQSDGSSGSYVHEDGGDNNYLDDDDRVWLLMSEGESVYHQPKEIVDGAIDNQWQNLKAWWNDEERASLPNKKFISRDDRGGSFEAVLQPNEDGSYTTNWLNSGTQQGTYNYSSPETLGGKIGHMVDDVLPHYLNEDYSPTPVDDPPAQQKAKTSSHASKPTLTPEPISQFKNSNTSLPITHSIPNQLQPPKQFVKTTASALNKTESDGFTTQKKEKQDYGDSIQLKSETDKRKSNIKTPITTLSQAKQYFSQHFNVGVVKQGTIKEQASEILNYASGEDKKTTKTQLIQILKNSKWAPWVIPNGDKRWQAVASAFQNFPATFGSIPSVSKIIFFRTDYAYSKGKLIPKQTGASYSGGRLVIHQSFSQVSKNLLQATSKSENHQDSSLEKVDSKEQKAGYNESIITHELGHGYLEGLIAKERSFMIKWNKQIGWVKGSLFDIQNPKVIDAIEKGKAPSTGYIVSGNWNKSYIGEQPMSEYSTSGPDEDFAESIRAYKHNKEALKKRSPARYKFIQKIISDQNKEEVQSNETAQGKFSTNNYNIANENKNKSSADIIQKMEASFGTSFSNVNIHKNSPKASNVGALAYTQGSDIHFAPGQFKPDTKSGQELIGHELAHVVQQKEGRVTPTTQAKGMSINDDPGLEKEADDAGRAFAIDNSSVQMKKSAAKSTNTLQKKDKLSQFDPAPTPKEAAPQKSSKTVLAEQFNSYEGTAPEKFDQLAEFISSHTAARRGGKESSGEGKKKVTRKESGSVALIWSASIDVAQSDANQYLADIGYWQDLPRRQKKVAAELHNAWKDPDGKRLQDNKNTKLDSKKKIESTKLASQKADEKLTKFKEELEQLNIKLSSDSESGEAPIEEKVKLTKKQKRKLKKATKRVTTAQKQLDKLKAKLARYERNNENSEKVDGLLTEIISVTRSVFDPAGVRQGHTSLKGMVTRAKGIGKNFAWSATTISYINWKAGMGNTFQYAESHIGYSSAANKSGGSMDFEKAFGTSATTVGLGDILVRSRDSKENKPANYGKLKGSTHGDLVLDLLVFSALKTGKERKKLEKSKRNDRTKIGTYDKIKKDFTTDTLDSESDKSEDEQFKAYLASKNYEVFAEVIGGNTSDFNMETGKSNGSGTVGKNYIPLTHDLKIAPDKAKNTGGTLKAHDKYIGAVKTSLPSSNVIKGSANAGADATGQLKSNNKQNPERTEAVHKPFQLAEIPSGVNLHKNSNKAKEVGALAYTQGSNIHFAPGQFKPDTRSGKELIGHELTHVVQQKEGRVKPTTQVNGMSVNDDPGLEKEADEAGVKFAHNDFTGIPSQDKMAPISGESIQRKVPENATIPEADLIDSGKDATLTKDGIKSAINFNNNKWKKELRQQLLVHLRYGPQLEDAKFAESDVVRVAKIQKGAGVKEETVDGKIGDETMAIILHTGFKFQHEAESKDKVELIFYPGTFEDIDLWEKLKTKTDALYKDDPKYNQYRDLLAKPGGLGKLYAKVNGTIVSVIDARGGPPVVLEDGTHTADPTKAGKYSLGKGEAYTTKSWYGSEIPWGSDISLIGGEIYFEHAASGKKGFATGPQSKLHSVMKKGDFDIDDGSGGKTIETTYRQNAFGEEAYRVKGSPGYFVHTTENAERKEMAGEDPILSISHGCIHIKPSDRTEFKSKGYLKKGAKLTVKSYDMKLIPEGMHSQMEGKKQSYEELEKESGFQYKICALLFKQGKYAECRTKLIALMGQSSLTVHEKAKFDHSIGSTYMKQGNFAMAISYYEKSYVVSNDPDTKKKLDECKAKMGPAAQPKMKAAFSLK